MAKWNSSGRIKITRQTNQLGGPERFDFAWEGGSVLPITRDLIEEAEVANFERPEDLRAFKIGPYRLRVIEYAPSRDAFLCIRQDYWLWRLEIAWHRINRYLEVAYRRFIITLAVWGMADYSRAAIPNAGQIHAVQVMQKMFAKVKRGGVRNA